MVYFSDMDVYMDRYETTPIVEVSLKFTGNDAIAISNCKQPDSAAHAVLSVLRRRLYQGMPDIHYIGTTWWGNRPAKPKIERVIFHDPATIVYWMDGTKTVVKAQNEKFDKEKGLLAAIAKKVYGNKGSFNNIIKHYVEE